MSEPIVWDAEGRAKVGGVLVYSEYNDDDVWEVWFSGGEVSIIVLGVSGRDLAARAVVAAVRALRGEPDAALAAEQERCAKVEAELRAALAARESEWSDMHDALRRCTWEGLTSAGELVPSLRLTERLSEARALLRAIESGAPAPREG